MPLPPAPVPPVPPVPVPPPVTEGVRSSAVTSNGADGYEIISEIKEEGSVVKTVEITL